MREFLFQYWYLGLILSVVVIVVQEWITRRRFAKMKQEMKVLELALEYTERDVASIQQFLECIPTVKTPVANRVVIQ